MRGRSGWGGGRKGQAGEEGGEGQAGEEGGKARLGRREERPGWGGGRKGQAGEEGGKATLGRREMESFFIIAGRFSSDCEKYEHYISSRCSHFKVSSFM